MNKKTLLILAAVSVGGCCLFGTGILVLGAMAPDDPAPGTASAAAATTSAGGNPKLSGYVIFGVSTLVHEGFNESLAGNWMLMDGAAVESIEEIHSDHVVTRSRRSGELWHYTFDADGSYAFRYVVTANGLAAIWSEKGQWSGDTAQLTLTPESCSEKALGEKNDCLEPAPRTYALSTLQFQELTAGDTQGKTFGGMRMTGPMPKWCQYASRDLQRVQ